VPAFKFSLGGYLGGGISPGLISRLSHRFAAYVSKWQKGKSSMLFEAVTTVHPTRSSIPSTDRVFVTLDLNMCKYS